MEPYSPNNCYVKEGRDGPKGRDIYKRTGPDCANFPTGIASAPVKWNYHGEIIDLAFKAGFVGATQDIETGTIRPLVGWFMQKED